MIIFDLICNADHPFEGWFQSQSSYDSQREESLITCPQCGSSEIRRVPSAIHLAKPANAPGSTDSSDPSEVVGPRLKIDTPSNLPAAYQQLVSLIVANSEDVGKDFAREARKIHYHEAPERSIRGQASKEDYEELRDEGIEVLRLPVLGKKVLN